MGLFQKFSVHTRKHSHVMETIYFRKTSGRTKHKKRTRRTVRGDQPLTFTPHAAVAFTHTSRLNVKTTCCQSSQQKMSNGAVN